MKFNFALRRFLWVKRCFPDKRGERINDSNKYFEVLSMVEKRKKKLVWLRCYKGERQVVNHKSQ
jgi:hypothetical protein